MNNNNSIAEAIAMIKHFRTTKENILVPKYQWTNIFPRCETFDRAVFEALLAEPGCDFINIYPGMDADNKIRLIAVSADSAHIDILHQNGL